MRPRQPEPSRMMPATHHGPLYMRYTVWRSARKWPMHLSVSITPHPGTEIPSRAARTSNELYCISMPGKPTTFTT